MGRSCRGSTSGASEGHTSPRALGRSAAVVESRAVRRSIGRGGERRVVERGLEQRAGTRRAGGRSHIGTTGTAAPLRGDRERAVRRGRRTRSPRCRRRARPRRRDRRRPRVAGRGTRNSHSSAASGHASSASSDCPSVTTATPSTQRNRARPAVDAQRARVVVVGDVAARDRGRAARARGRSAAATRACWSRTRCARPSPRPRASRCTAAREPSTVRAGIDRAARRSPSAEHVARPRPTLSSSVRPANGGSSQRTRGVAVDDAPHDADDLVAPGARATVRHVLRRRQRRVAAGSAFDVERARGRFVVAGSGELRRHRDVATRRARVVIRVRRAPATGASPRSTASRIAARTPCGFELAQPGRGGAARRRDRGAQRLRASSPLARAASPSRAASARTSCCAMSRAGRRARPPRSSPPRPGTRTPGPSPDSPVTASSDGSATRHDDADRAEQRARELEVSRRRRGGRPRSPTRRDRRARACSASRARPGRPGTSASSAAIVTPGRDRQHERSSRSDDGAARHRGSRRRRPASPRRSRRRRRRPPTPGSARRAPSGSSCSSSRRRSASTSATASSLGVPAAVEQAAASAAPIFRRRAAPRSSSAEG